MCERELMTVFVMHVYEVLLTPKEFWV